MVLLEVLVVVAQVVTEDAPRMLVLAVEAAMDIQAVVVVAQVVVHIICMLALR